MTGWLSTLCAMAARAGSGLGRAAGWLGLHALAYVFVAGAGYVVVTAAPDTPTLLLGLAGLAVLALVPALTLARGRWGAFAVMAPVVLLAGLYQATTAFEHLGRSLATRAEAARKADAGYAAAKAEVARLEGLRAGIKTVRGTREIEADLWAAQTEAQTPAGKGKVAPPSPPDVERVRALSGELGEAMRRGEIERDLTAARTALSRAEPSAGGAADGNMRRLARWLSGWTRLDLRDGADVRALLILLLVESGSFGLPMWAALLLASSRRRETDAGGDGLATGTAEGARPPAADPGAGPETDATVTRAAALPPEPPLADVAVVRAWAERRLRAGGAGVHTPSADLYRDYLDWCAAERAQPLAQSRWGIAMRQCGHEPAKRGKGGIRGYAAVLRGGSIDAADPSSRGRLAGWLGAANGSADVTTNGARVN